MNLTGLHLSRCYLWRAGFEVGGWGGGGGTLYRCNRTSHTIGLFICIDSKYNNSFLIQARKKHITLSVSGLVFAVHPLVVFILSPFVGKWVSTVFLFIILIHGPLYTWTGSDLTKSWI